MILDYLVGEGNHNGPDKREPSQGDKGQSMSCDDESRGQMVRED